MYCVCLRVCYNRAAIADDDAENCDRSNSFEIYDQV